MKLRKIGWAVNLTWLWSTGAEAHVAEQGFVLLLPTGAYTTAGVMAVALTVLALFVVPEERLKALFSCRNLASPTPRHLQTATSLLSFLAMCFAFYLGLNGPRDPLSNLLPLSFWTLGWIALVSLSGIFGNLWHWLNPWTGLYRLAGQPKPLLTLPQSLGLWPAVAVLMGFAAFLLADLAPDDPARLTRLLASYWTVSFAGLILFGPAWLRQAELGHAVFAAYATLAPVRLGTQGGIGGPGWRLVSEEHLPAAGIFALVLLGVGSFDGINETFWWLAQIGVNPLEFPGRSAVVVPTLTGLALSNVLLITIFALCVWLGLRLANGGDFKTAFSLLALSLLPIALVYHAAHFFTSFLVNVQYAVAAISDPFASGNDWLITQPFRVTTGFFNNIDTVRLIWLTQAGLVVLGHVWSVLLSHRIALDLFKSPRQAALGTLPISIFMIAYTFLGLWLLAAPKGA